MNNTRIQTFILLGTYTTGGEGKLIWADKAGSRTTQHGRSRFGGAANSGVDGESCQSKPIKPVLRVGTTTIWSGENLDIKVQSPKKVQTKATYSSSRRNKENAGEMKKCPYVKRRNSIEMVREIRGNKSREGENRSHEKYGSRKVTNGPMLGKRRGGNQQ